MRIKSPLSNLSETINQVKASAAQYKDTLQKNEAATRAVLIDPILRALGWDTANTFMVEVEKSFEQTRVDYALYDRNASVCIVVEAKPLGTPLNDSSITLSLVKYAYVYQTKQIFITDGLIWSHVTIKDPKDMPIVIENFAEDKVVDCAAYLVQHLDAARFWPEEETIDEVAQRVSQLESTLATLQTEISQIREHAANNPIQASITPATVSSLSLPASSDVLTNSAFVDLAKVGNVTHKPPSQLRLPDGMVVGVDSWKAVLRECCKFALSNNPNLPIPLSDRAGKKVRLFNTVQPASNISHITEEYNGQKIYIYLNYDGNNCIRNALYILNQVPTTKQTMKAGVILR